jgi:glycosyltransferase involved in cell wall biosynthesis
MSTAALDIVMYVINDVTHDSRVLREAGSLAAAGHRVTVIGTPLPAGSASPDLPGIEVRRVAVPHGDVWWFGWLRAPWLAVAGWLRTALRAHQRPTESAALLAASVASLPWVAVRGAWVALVNHALGRPVGLGWLRFLRTWRVERLGWDAAAVAAAPRADIHHAHDLEALPAARAGARRDGTRYVYDSHEIAVAFGVIGGQPAWLRWLMGRWERRMARGAAALVTVNRLIAADLTRRLSPRRTVIVHNCPPRWYPPSPPEDRLRRATGIPADVPVVLSHGGFMRGRGLEETAAALTAPGLETAHLVFLGYWPEYLAPILAEPGLAGRVHHLPAVPPGDVTAWVAGADVDVMAIVPGDRNRVLSTPNKLFESLAAGVPVVSTDLPARRAIVVDDPEGPLGALCEGTDPASIARAIRSILQLSAADRADLRARCLRAAHQRWNWETEGARLVALYDDLGAVAPGR